MGHIRLRYSNLGPNGQLAVGAYRSTKLYGDTSKYITLQKKNYVCFKIQLILLKTENNKKKNFCNTVHSFNTVALPTYNVHVP